MSWWSRIRNVIQPEPYRDEIREELDFHLAMDQANGQETREARLRLGNATRLEEETREMGITTWLESILQDARHALRQIRRSPGLSAAVLISLALGLGANNAIFSLVDAALLKQLPVHDPESLVSLKWVGDKAPKGMRRMTGSRGKTKDGRARGDAFSEDVYRRLASQQDGYASMAGVSSPRSVSISTRGQSPNQVQALYVSSNFFDLLGISPSLGRSFLPQEERRGDVPAIVLSHRYWTSHMGADPAVLGQTIQVNSVPSRIVGIAPSSFFGPTVGEWIDVYAPLASVHVLDKQYATPGPGGDNGFWWVRLVARLRPDTSAEAAVSRSHGVFRNLAADSTGAEVQPSLELATSSAAHGLRAFDEDMTKALWILTILVGVLLLIVCANVANLLLSRSVGRQREASVRLALGAPRARLFRFHLIECGVFGLLGGTSGVAIGYALSHFLLSLTQSSGVSANELDLTLNWRVMAFSMAMALLTALVFGIAPSWRAAKADVNQALKADSRSVAGGGLRLPRVLVSLQFAFCLVALIAAGLLSRSVMNLASFDVGFRSEGLYYASVNPSQVGYTPERAGAFVERLLQEVQSIPGVEAATPIADRLLSDGGSTTSVTTPWGPPASLDNGQFNPDTVVFEVSGGGSLIETLGIPLVIGETFQGDQAGAGKAIVDEAFARRFLPNRNPIGQQITVERRQVDITGVVRTIREFNVRDNPLPAIYLPMDLANVRREVHLAIRSAIPAEQLALAVRQRVASIDAAVPVTAFTSQTELTSRLFTTDRLLALVSAAFGAAAILLAAVGLFGLLAYSVARRRNEIGVRIALGAEAKDIIRMVLSESVWMVVAGVLIGLPAAYFVSRYLEASLFGLDPVDPMSAAFALTVLLLVAFTAAWLPARRAAQVNPVGALRGD